MSEGGGSIAEETEAAMFLAGMSEPDGGRFCEEHQKEENRRYEKYGRDPAVRRRYGRAWKRIRDKYASEHPLCEQCLKAGRYVRPRRSTISCRCLKAEPMNGAT